MLIKIFAALAVILAALTVVIQMQPSEFRITRTAAVSAPPETVFPHVNDLRQWKAWSPWAKIDPNAKETFEGPAAGNGAIFRWNGNHEIGAGSMEITESRSNELIKMKLEFLKPFKGVSDVEFTFKPEGAGTAISWSMSGTNNFLAKAIGLVMNCEKMVGAQYEKGLANLKLQAETAAV